MPTAEVSPLTDAPELQNVLTRYVDSCDGYTQVAAVIESPHLASAFLEIAERRRVIVEHVSTLIRAQGEKAMKEGSSEAAIHRWWIRLRVQMTSEELEATLAECVRGEKELQRTIRGALEQGALESANSAILRDIATELDAAIQTFESALGR